MHVIRIAFSRTHPLAPGVESSVDAVRDVLDAWRMNGQVCGREWPIVGAVDGYSAVVLSPEGDALDERFHSDFSKTAIADAEAAGLRLTYEDLGEDIESGPTCSCSNPDGYALFTTYVSLEPPIRCMDCWRPVALYRLKPMPSGEFYELIVWQSDYQSCDRLQMNCMVLERAATREISSLDSALTTIGRTHCATLAELMGRPVYYYLYRGHGRSRRSEHDRRCPSCGGEWLLDTRLHEGFDFKCDRCHLVSNVAHDVTA